MPLNFAKTSLGQQQETRPLSMHKQASDACGWLVVGAQESSLLRSFAIAKDGPSVIAIRIQHLLFDCLNQNCTDAVACSVLALQLTQRSALPRHAEDSSSSGR
jgi:hypothetical protein